MKILKQLSIVISFLLFLIPFLSFSQTSNDVEMADTFREQGKIYVVIAVIGIILIGLIVYLILIDRKVSGIEKKMGKDQEKKPS